MTNDTGNFTLRQPDRKSRRKKRWERLACLALSVLMAANSLVLPIRALDEQSEPDSSAMESTEVSNGGEPVDTVTVSPEPTETTEISPEVSPETSPEVASEASPEPTETDVPAATSTEAVTAITVESDLGVPMAAAEEDSAPYLSYSVGEVSDIALDVPQTVPPTVTTTYRAYYRFAVPYTHEYIFESSGTRNTCGYLFDSTGKQVAYTSSGGTGNNFKITKTLVESTTYYWGAKLYSTTGSGTFDVTLRLGSHDFSTADGVCVCGATIEDVGGSCGTADSDITWSISKDGVLKISGTGAMTDYYNAPYTPWYVYRAYISSVEISGNITHLGNYAFSGYTNLDTFTWNCTTPLESVGTYTFGYYTSTATKAKTFVIGQHAVVNPTLFTYVTKIGGITDPLKALQGVLFQYAGDDYVLRTVGDTKVSLTAGSTYFCDENGIFYQLYDDGTAAVLFCPSSYAPEDDSSLVPSVLALDEECTYTVTAIGDYACYDCDLLTAVTLPDTITSIGDYAFYDCDGITDIVFSKNLTAIGSHSFYGCNSLTQVQLSDSLETIGAYAFGWCTALQSAQIPSVSLGQFAFSGCAALDTVNGLTELSAVLAALGASDSTVFMNTALWNGGTSLDSITTDGLELSNYEEGNHYKLSLSLKNQELLTGEYAQFTIMLDDIQHDVTDTLRVYFQMEEGNSVEDGGKLFGYAKDTEIVFGSGDASFTGTFHTTDTPYLYYVELRSIQAGQTRTLDLQVTYPNWTTAGGSMLVWLDNSRSTTQMNQVIWKTQTDSYSVSESAPYNLTIQGDGTANSAIYVSGLTYSMQMKRTSTGDYGKNPAKNITYQNALTLPDGFSWDADVLESVRCGNWKLTSTSSYYSTKTWTLTTTLMKDGESVTYTLATLSFPSTYSGYVSNIHPVVTDNGLEIAWTQTNPSVSADINLPSYTLTYGPKVILADAANLADAIDQNGGKSVTYGFTNTVSTTVDFFYGGEATQSGNATSSKSVGAATFTMSKSANPSYSVVMGKDVSYTITLSNSSVLPYTTLDHVEDTLPNLYVIQPESMDTMFADASLGKYLTITIQNLTIYNSFSTATVTNTAGVSKETTTPDYTSGSKTVTIAIKWASDQSHLELYMDDELYATIGADCPYATIADAFAVLPYIVFRDTTYTCSWDQQGQDLYSGETRTFSIPATVKSSFMYLTADKEETLLASSYSYSALNRAYTYYNYNETTGKYASTSYGTSYPYIYRDFQVAKSVAFADNGSISSTTEITPGSVLYYTNTVTRSATVAYDALPMTDTMTGAQVLLVPVAENAGNADLENAGLSTMEVSGTTYYILNRSGTYRSIWLGDSYADSITVSQGASGTTTQFRWYWTFAASSGTASLHYNALVDPDLAGCATDSSVTFALNDNVYLNDLFGHRLYDTVGLYGARVSMGKQIVTNVTGTLDSTHDYAADKLTDNSVVLTGQTVTYRLELTGIHSDSLLTNIVLTGDDFYDTLPSSLHNYWTQDNVSVTYVTVEGSTVTISDTSTDAWYIDTATESADGVTQQVLRWNSNFFLTLDGTVYIYVQLTFPENTKASSDWTEYVKILGDATLVNTWKVLNMEASVTHTLSVQAEAVLEKGVYATGTVSSTSSTWYNYTSKVVYSINTNEDGRWFYTNDSSAYGIVTYYIVLYNSGLTKLYLNDIQDSLPEGFTFLSLYNNYGASTGTYALDKYVIDLYSYKTSAKNTGYYNKLLSLGNDVTYKTAQINAKVSTSSQVTFSLSGSGISGTTIAYDSEYGKYYLAPNEAVVIAYSCRTNAYSADVDEATNQAAMLYDDFNGAGVTLTPSAEVSMLRYTDLAENNGSGSLATTAQVKSWGLDVSSADTQSQWLTSAVTLEKGNIIPGIQKKCTASSTPYVTDSISWAITASNEGNENLLDYTLTDVMMSPYQFTGDVTYQLYNAKGTAITSAVTLFSFLDGKDNDNRTNQDSQVTIYYGSKQATLTVGGPEVEITNSTLGTMTVSLSRDADTGNEQLSIRFTGSKAALVPGGQGLLTLSTKNYTASALSKSYTNECYITPMVQEFDSSLVTQGNAVTFNLPQGDTEAPSVHCEAMTAVSYGYSSGAVKTVTELNSDLTATTNTTTSQSGTNYIVLSQDKDSIFRYSLSMQNTGGRSGSMAVSKYVLVDNLPQVGDHTTLNTEYLRYSDFQVDFAAADQLQFEVSITKGSATTVLDASQYSLMFSTKTNFDDDGTNDALWNGDDLTAADGWYTLEECKETLGTMRSLRVVIHDENLTNLMPAEATITVSFNAIVDPNSDPDYSAVAWNSFAYRYTVVGNGTMQAAPMKVGVKLKGIPHLQKSLLDEYGSAYTASADETFRFLIYGSKDLNFSADATDAEKLTQLANRGIPFTIASITVKAGTSASAQEPLETQKRWTYDPETNQLTESTENWNWTDSQAYTATELLGDGSSDFYLSSMNGKHSDSYTFTYHEATSVNIHGVNQRKSWNLLVNKTDNSGDVGLEGAIFGLYSQVKPETSPVLSSSIPQYLHNTQYATYVDSDGTTWYLAAMQETGSGGQTTFEKLTADTYLLRELQAPSGYVMDSTQLQVIQAPDSGTGTVEVSVVNLLLVVPTDAIDTTSGQSALMLLFVAAGLWWLLPKFVRARKKREGDSRP